jgi:hypothetical protein
MKKSKSEKKISKVMNEFKAGTLNSGSPKGPKVKSQKQARARRSEALSRRDRRLVQFFASLP